MAVGCSETCNDLCAAVNVALGSETDSKDSPPIFTFSPSGSWSGTFTLQIPFSHAGSEKEILSTFPYVPTSDYQIPCLSTISVALRARYGTTPSRKNF